MKTTDILITVLVICMVLLIIYNIFVTMQLLKQRHKENDSEQKNNREDERKAEFERDRYEGGEAVNLFYERVEKDDELTHRSMDTLGDNGEYSENTYQDLSGDYNPNIHMNYGEPKRRTADSDVTRSMWGDESETRRSFPHDEDDTEYHMHKTKKRYLILTDKENRNKRYESEMIDDRVIIGRGEEADLSIDNDKAVSRKHCEIYWDGGAYKLININEKNYVWIGDYRLEFNEEIEIQDGTIVEIGSKEYKIRIEEE